MRKNVLIMAGFVCALPFLQGCQTVNESVRQPSQAVGTVLAIPQSITQGVNSGYTTQTGTTVSNPYNR